uniref:Phosphatidylglycerol lysyltransferase C-terminal domain-containing protein n=1 Tax=Chromera velia CCMP2878 TaxID=1169474 RepID=A0A0G4I5P0_9ALVE|eukprot:Cvel_11222.t1-p1 / transcript=Cvel_11222.t1 / gene=Cvel_11222 / organism=Chromera_velia_CCMP2878 / gene_product=hypothetical protein / transcript_product=hypothetical protein / location=Cvel_scaffold698:24905-27016(+) / protein_length=388 / sequence_SO=supercontig / SO=protein_coding / is_pseudo=false
MSEVTTSNTQRLRQQQEGHSVEIKGDPGLLERFSAHASLSFRRLDSEDVSDLQCRLHCGLNECRKQQECPSVQDPCRFSAAYFLMTGRKGLWIVELTGKDEAGGSVQAASGSSLLLCAHPNSAGRFLIFPPWGGDSNGRTALIDAVWNFVAKSGVSVQLARFPAAPHVGFREVEETLLDWRFPVHILDTQKVVKKEGFAFKQFRWKLHCLQQKHRVEKEDLQPGREEDRREAMKLLNTWRPGDDHSVYDCLLSLFPCDNDTETETAITEAEAPCKSKRHLNDLLGENEAARGKLRLRGRFVRADGNVVGMSIWEETDPQGGMANAYANVALHDFPGSSQHVHWDMCRCLADRGFSFLSLGGSETAGLDLFKQKMRPVQRVELKSFVLD